jgi:trk system potassium uptake protein
MLRPTQQVVLGFAAYVLIGTLLLALPISSQTPAPVLDHLFNATSAVSTTGLTTISVADSYSWFGEFVILCLFQVGGIGFMTLSSVLILARGGKLSESRVSVLRAGFALPVNFKPADFVVQVVMFTLACELVGAGILWWRFAALGVENPLWSAVFHAVSAFATAGFSLNNTSLELFAKDWVVNLTVGALCYLGGIGFIVAQDVWYSVRFRERMLTLTSKVILVATAVVFIAGTAGLMFLEPSVRDMPFTERFVICAFQTMSASSTAGFNTIPIGAMAPASLMIIVIAMLIGASPSGTGGGMKTTSVTAALGNTLSVLRGRDRVVWFGHEIPMPRVLLAYSAAFVYLAGLALGVLLLCVTERKDFLALLFEAASALGTVGLSMGITGDLSPAGKIIIIALMFIGRCGPLTIGFALLNPVSSRPMPREDLAV